MYIIFKEESRKSFFRVGTFTIYMKRYNNKFRKFDKRTKHNQNKPFEPGRYGKNWGSIKVELAKGVDITFSEANRIMEELNDAKHRYNVASRMGMLDATTGTPSIYRES